MTRFFTRACTTTVCSLAIAATCGCGSKQAPFQRPPAAVKTVLAVQTNTPVTVRAFGHTEDGFSVDVVPQVSGTLVQTFVKDGAIVTNGQPLFLIDPRDYAARVRQMEGVLQADRANLELARATLERNRGLGEKNLISAETFDTIKAKLDAVTGQVQMDEALLEQARLNLARCTISAMLSGVCSKRYVDDGNLVAAGMTRLINIRSYDPMNVEFSVSEQYLPLLRNAMAEGQLSMRVIPGGSTNQYTGVLTFMDNAVNQMSGTILLRGQVPNQDLKLWANQFVDIAIHAGTVRDAVMVPEGAVQFGKMGPYLFVVTEENLAAMRIVKTGIRFRDTIQILDGVAPGDRVVVLGQLMLFPGAPVAEAAGAPPAGGAPQHGGK